VAILAANCDADGLVGVIQHHRPRTEIDARLTRLAA